MANTNKPWKEYEKEVADYFRLKFGGETILYNEKRPGILSGTERQIDILIEKQVGDQYIAIAVECKQWKTKIDVADVGEFIDRLNDLRITKGFMISEKGFTEAAYNRALREPHLQLYVLDFSQLSDKIGFWGNPYRGKYGAFVSAPSGWIVDAAVSKEIIQEIGPCILYPMGFSFDQALERGQIMSFDIRPFHEAHAETIQGVFEVQNEVVKKRDPNMKVKMWTETHAKGNILFREIKYDEAGYTEYSAGAESDRFIAYFVLVSVHESREQNLAKLKYMFDEIVFIVLDYANPLDSHGAWKEFLNKKILSKNMERNKDN